MAGQIKYIAPVDSVSGMFGKREHSFSGKAIISNVRKTASQKYPGGHMYFSVLTKTTYRSTAAMVSWQETFVRICEATRARMINPETIAQDQADFAAQTKYKTFYSFIWNKMREEVVG